MNKFYSGLLIIFALSFRYSTSCVAQANVGIGITAPTEKLHVDSGAVKIGSTVWSAGINYHWIKFGDGDFVGLGEDSVDDNMVFSAGNFIFMPSTTSYFGNVGIGESQPTAKLDLLGTFKYRDGTEGAGKILTSDLLGNATWEAPTTTGTVTMKVCIALAGVFPSFGGGPGPSADTYIGEIKIFPYAIAPNGWAECNGQLLSISQNTALFSLIGTTYGGDGVNNFALPNLTNKVVVGN